jgi:hypothetical protein
MSETENRFVALRDAEIFTISHKITYLIAKNSKRMDLIKRFEQIRPAGSQISLSQ